MPTLTGIFGLDVRTFPRLPVTCLPVGPASGDLPELALLTAMRSIGDLRAAAALPHSRETFPFNETTLVFKVGGPPAGKMYAPTDILADPLQVSLKVRPEHGEELRAAHPAIQPGFHLNKRHWTTVTLGGTVPDALLWELLASSHALVVRGMTRAERAKLGAERTLADGDEDS